MISRHKFVALAAACALHIAIPAAAQEYPSQSPVIVVPFAAGGPFDVIGREVSEALSKHFGKQFVVENRPGAGGVTATRYVMAANPDGYTLLLGSPGPMVIAPRANPGTLDIDGKLQPVGIISQSPQVFVVSSKIDAKTVADLVKLAQAKPGSMNFGSAGMGTTPHLSAELFKSVAQIDLQHVPYRGTAAAMQDLIRGELQMLFGDIATLRPYIESGSVRALAVTGAERSKLLPNIPTTAEAGFPRLVVRNFSVLLAPAKTAPDALDKLASGLAKVKANPAFIARMERLGMAMMSSSPKHAREFLNTEREQWEPLVRKLSMKATR